MRITFSYYESDDPCATTHGLSFNDVIECIKEHNDNFGTDYETISEFNEGEDYSYYTAVIVYDKIETN